MTGNVGAPYMVEKLKQIRKENRISIKKLSNNLGYHRNAISFWEHGHNQPSLGAFLSWAQTLGYRVELTKD
jgi:transcriptional regulator with XRE-family HTH domain